VVKVGAANERQWADEVEARFRRVRSRSLLLDDPMACDLEGEAEEARLLAVRTRHWVAAAHATLLKAKLLHVFVARPLGLKPLPVPSRDLRTLRARVRKAIAAQQAS
jgi:hypothetical protein